MCCSFIDKGVISRNASDGQRTLTSIDVVMKGGRRETDEGGRSSNLSVGAHGVGGFNLGGYEWQRGRAGVKLG